MKKYLLFCLATVSLSAHPHHPTVVEGDASFKQMDAATLHITTSERAVINWKDFSIDAGKVVQFIQPRTHSAVLNRVTSSTPSSIMGNLNANGSVYLINPNGMIIGENAVINTASFFASTYNISDTAFMAGEGLIFTGDSKASIINYGVINSWDGDVALLGYKVENQGKIHVQEGTAALGAGQEILLKPEGSIFIRVQGGDHQGTGVVNSGIIEAVRTELKADGNAYQFAINHTGKIDALGCCDIDGEVYLIAEEGTILVSGEISAPTKEIRILGDHVDMFGNAMLDVSGARGGGTILIGGDYQGKNPSIVNAHMTHIDETVVLKANALKNGDGGTVIIWSDENTWMKGTVQARGGSQSGNGGFVEISSKGDFNISGFTVDTRAPMGKTGELLLDPATVYIDSSMGPTSGMITPAPPYTPVCPACPIVFMFSTAAPAIINTTDLINALGCCDVTINAANSSVAGTGSITFNPSQTASPASDVSWSGNSLTLIANSSAADSITILGIVQNMGAGDINITTPNLFVGLSNAMQTTTCSLATTSGDVIINNADFTTNILCTGGTGIFGQTEVGSLQGNLTIGTALAPITGDITMLGGTGTTPGVNGVEFAVGGAGTLSINTNGNIILDNTGQQAPLAIISSGLFGTSPIDITGTTGSTTLTMKGGTGTTHAAVLIGTAISGAMAGDINININGDFILQGGSSTADSFASINAAQMSGTGNVNLTGRNFMLTGGSQATLSDNSANIITGPGGSGTITLNASGGITMQGGDFMNTQTEIGTLAFTGSNTVTINAAGALQMTGGAATVASIFTFSMGSPINIQNCASLSITGGGATAAQSAIFTVGAASPIDINVAGDTALISGVIGANIFTASPGAGNDVTVTGGGSCSLSSSTGSAQIGVEGSGNVALTFGGSYQMSGPSVVVTVLSVGTVTIVAGTDLILNDSAVVSTMNGDITLVSDNLFPFSDAPLFGNTNFVKTAGALILAATPGTHVRIFSATRPLDTIVGSVNQTTYVQGIEFLDSPTEEWGCYFGQSCASFGGIPFTFFFKNTGVAVTGVPKHGYNQFLTAVGEAFRDWTVYFDFDTTTYEECQVEYNIPSYNQLPGKQGKEIYFIPRTGYNNYNTYWLNSQ